MPYQGQVAGKTGHSDLLNNQDLSQFLENCDYLTEPGEAELQSILARFQRVAASPYPMPVYTLASDGSLYESSIAEDFPSTRVGYLKISQIVVDMEIYQRLAGQKQRFVNPFELNRLAERKDALTMVLPSTNLRYNAAKTVRDGFRRRLYEIMMAENMQLDGYPLLDTLYVLALKSETHGFVNEQGQRIICIKKCPQCSYHDPETKYSFEIAAGVESLSCPQCASAVYASDVLRLHEEVQDFESNASVLGRVMNAFEHLLLAHYIHYLSKNDPRSLSEMAFMMDGPLAVFGQPAWLRTPMQRLIYEANQSLLAKDFKPFLVLGLEKTGQVVEHFNTVIRALKRQDPQETDNPPESLWQQIKGKLMLLSDPYRDTYIKQREPDMSKNFGEGTYYGQHFLYLSQRGNPFVFTVPYPFLKKEQVDQVAFRDLKSDLRYYTDLERVIRLVELFEADLFQSSVVPVILAHGEASISLTPGGKVLDLVSLRKFRRRQLE